MEVQVFDDSSFSGFIDDNQYSNFVPTIVVGAAGFKGVNTIVGNKEAKKINARVDVINANTAKLKAETDAYIKSISEQEKATQEKIKQAKELQAKLEEATEKPISIIPTNPIPSEAKQDVPQKSSGNPLASIPKPVLIGGGVILALVVVLLVVRR
jgi:hypothetical protein